MSIEIESSDELEQLRTRLREMSDDEFETFWQGGEKSLPRLKMSRHLETSVGRGACRVAAPASQDAVMDLPQWCFSASKVGRRMHSEQGFRALLWSDSDSPP